MFPLSLVAIWLSLTAASAILLKQDIIAIFSQQLVKTRQDIIFGCDQNELLRISRALQLHNHLVYPLHINSSFELATVLSRMNHAATAVIVNGACANRAKLLQQASSGRYFNKTYQWLLLDDGNQGIEQMFPYDIDYLGPNAQMTFVNSSVLANNGTNSRSYLLWDVHSKGRHLKSPLEVHRIARIQEKQKPCTVHFDIKVEMIRYDDIFWLQGIENRDRFNGLTLRGASVIDQDNVTTNEKIERILSRPTKDSGVAAFIKYHYELLTVLRERFNFTVNFRNARGWAGRLGNSTFRLGFLGIIKRNEADIGASSAFNRINRFAEFDTIHQSWRFETAFLYRFTPDLNLHNKGGNFLAPFEAQVWIFAICAVIVVSVIWQGAEWIHRKWRNASNNILANQEEEEEEDEHFSFTKSWMTWTSVSLKTLAAVCQQGMEELPRNLPSRAIILTLFLFSLVMYNYYTSSVVGGLLSNTAKGPSTVNDIVSSPLKLSFEDIGYYKVLFVENKSPIIARLLKRKLLPPRDPQDLPVYAHIEDAIPFLQKGSFAFHCEVVDAYPEIAKKFDQNEICDLRVVSGLMETELMNWVVHKNSQYTEIFRVAMCRAREAGFIERLLRQRQTPKPKCQALYTVYPVSLSGVLSAFLLLCGGGVFATITLFLEILRKQCTIILARQAVKTH